MFYPVTTKEEIDLVARLAKEIWTEHYINFLGAPQIAYMLEMYQSPAAIGHQIAGGAFRYYLISVADQPIGYLGVELREQTLFLSKLYLKQEMRGRGLARQALAFLEGVAREQQLSSITLTVNKKNTQAIAVYETMGFEHTAAPCVEIGGGFVMDDYEMVLPLPAHQPR